MSRVDPSGLSRILSYIKSWVTSALSSKANNSHSHSDYVPTSGGAVMGGATKIKIAKSDNSGELRLDGGTDWGNGGSLVCHGKDDPLDTGAFVLNASNGTNSYMLMGFPNGTLTWGGVAISLSNHTHSGYAASSHTHTKSQITDFPTIPTNTSQLINDSGFWTGNGGTWNPYANISLPASGNGQEWSFDMHRNGTTGCYWHVWEDSLGTCLSVSADDGSVSIPRNILYLGGYRIYVG